MSGSSEGVSLCRRIRWRLPSLIVQALPNDHRESHRPWLPAALAAALGLLLYVISIGGTYVYDDWAVLGADDPRLAHPNLWWQYWTQSYNGGVDNLYRPIVSMTYAAQWWLHGVHESTAWAFHLVNVLSYAGVCALVAELARRLNGMKLALLAGLLFAAHPIHVEATAYIVGRAELMCALGAVGALVLMLKRPMTTARAIAITGCCV